MTTFNDAVVDLIQSHFQDIHQGATLTDIFPDAEPVLQQAYGVMQWAHCRQNRKGPLARPYHQHPLMVFVLVRLSGGSLSDQTVALLHDVVEDAQKSWPGVTRADVLQAIQAQFGPEVARRVDLLSNPEGLAKADKKDWQLQQLRQHGEIVTIKLADKLANSYDTVFDAPEMWDGAEVQRQQLQALEMITPFRPQLPQALCVFFDWLTTQEVRA